ncbi:unnamed protein product [Arctogadus glacialis]
MRCRTRRLTTPPSAETHMKAGTVALSAGGWGIRGGFRFYPPVLNKSLLAQSAVQPCPPLTRAHNDSLNQRLAITAAAH